MYIIPLTIVILMSLALSLKRNGLGSFVTLGVLGAAIYTIPALVNMQMSLASRAVKVSSVGYISVSPQVEVVVLTAWVALLFGLVISTMMFRKRQTPQGVQVSEDVMRSIAMASAILAVIGILYLIYSQDSFFFFLEARDEQDTGAVSTLWRWTAVIGLVSAFFGRDRKLMYFHGLIVFLIFLRGDRTLVAISTAALIAAVSYRDPKWWTRLKPLQIAAFLFAVGVVFLGKTLYLSAKASITGVGVSRFQYSLTFQFLNQFEPMATFSHLEFVMRTGLTIGLPDFFKSVAGNILLVPSFFDIKTNLYNAVVTSKLSAAKADSGIAGNFLAHGYVVGGIVGAALFYFFLPLLLTLCDTQFHKKSGTVKMFWCCTGAVIAFYIHRNGLDNEFSFVRQIFIVSVFTAIIAAAIRQFTGTASPVMSNLQTRPAAPLLTDKQFALGERGSAS